jgi:hypothetical protein
MISSLTFDPSGRFLYATLFASNQIYAFQLTSTGMMTPIPNSPFLAYPKASEFTKPPMAEISSKDRTGIVLTPRYRQS